MAFYKATDMSVWAAGPTGVNAGGWGLTLSPIDMAKLGQLVLNGGVFQADGPAWIGVAVLEFWCAYFCPVAALSLHYFRGQTEQR